MQAFHALSCEAPAIHVSANTAILAGQSTPLQAAGTGALAFDGVGAQVNVTEVGTSNPALLTDVVNTFTVEAWVNPTADHQVDEQQNSGLAGLEGQRYLIFPAYGAVWGDDHAGMGLSVGKNGVSVYELAGDYMPALLVWKGSLTTWTHVAVVYQDGRPSLYINGEWQVDGEQSGKAYVHPSLNIGGDTNGHFAGQVDEVRIWSEARQPAQLLAQYKQVQLTPTANMVACWHLDEGSGSLTEVVGGPWVSTLTRGHVLAAWSPVPAPPGPLPQWQAPSSAPLTPDPSSTGLTYSWSPATGLDQATGGRVNASPPTTTTYTVTATNSCGQQSTAHVTVTVSTPLCVVPVLHVSPNATLTAGQSTPLQVQPVTSALDFDGTGAQVSVTQAGTSNQAMLPDVVNTFTVEAWVKPTAPHEVDGQWNSGVGGTSGQRYLIFPFIGQGEGHAGMGISVGTNGVSVYEHAGGYMPALLVWTGDLHNWTHLAVVYQNGRPSLYINGRWVADGEQSGKAYVHPSLNIGGSYYGYFAGQADEVRIWRESRQPAQLLAQYQQALPTPAPNLVACWHLDEGNGTVTAEAAGGPWTSTLTRSQISVNGNPTPAGPLPQWQVPSPAPVASLTYSWSPTTGLDQTTGARVNASPTTTTTYTVTATTACGEQTTAQVTVTAPPLANLPPCDPSDDSNRNWTLERSFDGNGNEVAASKQFTDGLGRATQAQARNAATKQVFAAQTIYNTGGQPVLQTLAAPTNNQCFKYKEGFIQAAGQDYGPVHFEEGQANNPAPVDATTIGTLGYYYSQLNAGEPLTPITSYPYSLTEPYEGPMGGTRRAAGPGDELRMGKGREAKGRDFPLRKEFDRYLALRPNFVPGSPLTSLEYQGVKSVSINADGRESIIVANKDGQAIISCLSGSQYPALPVEGYISAEGPTNPYDASAPAYQDIHLPAAGAQEVKFTMDPSYTDGGRVLVVNLLTSDTISYAIKPATTGAAPEQRITLTPGFYRFVSVTGTQRASYEAHYGDFSYTYYDDAGRVIATVAPNGVGGSNLLANPGFEQDLASTAPPSGWQAYTNRLADTYSQQGTSAAPAHSGQFFGMHRTSEPGGHSVYTCQIIKNLPNGLYTARAWVKNSAITQNWPNQVASLLAKEYDNTGSQRGADLPITGSAGNWVRVQITDIPVTNGQCMLGLYSISPTAEWIAFDDVELVRQVDTSSPSFTTLNTYDARSRLLATESTDEGRSEYVYAQDGRIRFSQSALQRPAGRFSYSNYDEVGRVVESGEYTPGSLKFENHLTASPAANSVLQPSLLEDRTRGGGLAEANCAQRNQVWYDLPFDGTDGSQGSDSQLNGRHQEFVVGAVAKTKNDNVTTWYSYDELGRVTWVVQDVAGVGVKTLDYKYDFSGNVLEVAYQKNQADSFYHYYGYDAAQRLTSVNTSANGTTRTLQAQYSYYLHGPLKRVQVAGNLQGVDYTYTLQGALKAINHVNQTLEPGHDAPAANGVYKDLFALTLDYFSGDYRSRAIDAPLPIAGGVPVPTRYDGTIQGAAWRTGASAGIHRVAYTYDEKSQLQNSQYGKWDWQKNSSNYLLNPASANALQEGNLRYDANGNIQSLRRTDQAGNVTDDFSYGYKPNTNQLKEVHTGSAAGPTVLDYDYDELGQLVRQRDEKGQSYLSYDVTGKTTGFYADAARTQPLVTFAYDDRGFRVSKTAYANGVARQTTTYVRDVAGNILTVYEQLAPGAAAQRAEVPLYGASRLGSLTHLNDGTAAGLDDYRYELNDHLGDARVVFHRPTTTVNVETMELSGVPSRAAFLNDDRYRVAVSGAPSGDYVARLTDSQPAGQELKRVLSVSKGDTITFSALAQWKQNAAAGGNSTTPFILAGAAAGLAPLSQRGPEGQTAYQTNSPNWLSLLAAGLGFTLGGGNQTASLGSTSLTGWIKYRVLDANGNEQASGRDYLLGTGKWEYLQTGVRIEQAGTIEVMAGTSGSGEAVYFDNLRVEQTGGLIVQEQHQYAYGAPLPGLSYVVGSKRYRYGYQGQYAERDDETGFESFELRLYNSRIGRWLSYDPEGQFNSPYVGMGNNPVSGVDPDGGFAVPLPKFRPSGSGAASGLSSLAKWGMRIGSSLLRTTSSYLEKGDAWVHSDAGERAGQQFANLHPWVQLMNVRSAYKSGTDIYGNSMSEGQAREAMSGLLFPVPEGGMGEGVGEVGRISIGAIQLEKGALLNTAKNARLRNIIENLWRDGAETGSGSAMDAVRNELKTGLPTKGKFHTQKLNIAANGLRNSLNRRGGPGAQLPQLSPQDASIARYLLNDIHNALHGL